MAVIHVEFAGGVELLFDNVKKLTIPLECVGGDTASKENKILTIKDLLQRLRQSYLKQRPELFLQGDSIKPGILVVINDCDWELMGGPDYALAPGDTVVFISTLHGG
ncbi:putative Ubiquitin-related modifier 1 [Hypsibius exemplaris]|uniref:Ubiquitin-related modifier 1 homolog n=1 Tax=Hypsibius exemplaris TaxID=2072580 RepID=A0A1W0WGH4_HYPEX|nr:putative Ubiquitin-related modifier 1 [Hypsibius exemplaris]